MCSVWVLAQLRSRIMDERFTVNPHTPPATTEMKTIMNELYPDTYKYVFHSVTVCCVLCVYLNYIIYVVEVCACG